MSDNTPRSEHGAVLHAAVWTGDRPILPFEWSGWPPNPGAPGYHWIKGSDDERWMCWHWDLERGEWPWGLIADPTDGGDFSCDDAAARTYGGPIPEPRFNP